MASTATDSAQEVAGTAKQEAGRTSAEAQRQAKDLLRQGQSELNDQAGAQQERLAGGLRAISSELEQMVHGTEQEGMASHVVCWVAAMSDDAGQWLEQRDPGDVVTEGKHFARRRPGAFILAAAGLGLVVGRVAVDGIEQNVGVDQPHDALRMRRMSSSSSRSAAI